MELKGSITLDKETMNVLKEKVREDVMKDIEKSGLYFEEVERYLQQCSYKTYANLFERTLDDLLNRTNPESITWRDDKRKWQKLQAIKTILEL